MDPKIRLFVEGKDDLTILSDCWLSKLPSAPRQAPQFEHVKGAGGCTQVACRVQADLHDRDVIAMGLTDRDVLIQNKYIEQGLPVFLNVDDQSFAQQAPQVFGDELAPRMWVLHHHEVENLLLTNLDALHNKQVHKKKESTPRWSDEENVAEHLMLMAKELLPRQAASLCARALNPTPEVEFGDKHSHNPTSPEKVRDELKQSYAWLDASTFATREQGLLAFAASADSSYKDQWKSLNRIVKGKWIFQMLCARWTSLKIDPLREDLARTLVDKNHGQPPAEIVTLFKAMQQRAKEIAHEPANPPKPEST